MTMFARQHQLWIGKSRQANRPCRDHVIGSGSDFVEALIKESRVLACKDGPYFIPVMFRDCNRKFRTKRDIHSVWAFVLDLDQGDDWSVVQARLDGLGVPYIAYPSYFNGLAKVSPTDTEPPRSRWRAIVLIDQPILCTVWDSVYSKIANYLVGAGNWDSAARDASRLWYLPRTNHHIPPPIIAQIDCPLVSTAMLLSLPNSCEDRNHEKRGKQQKRKRGMTHPQINPIEMTFNRSIGMREFVALLLEDGFHNPTTGIFEGRPQVRMTRPGKDGCDGCSVTITEKPIALLYVFSSSLPGLPAGRYYAPFEYIKHMRCGSTDHAQQFPTGEMI